MKIKKIILIFITIFFVLNTILLSTFISNASYNQQTLEPSNNGISLFPASYQIMLNKLVEGTGHTNWKFKPLYTDIDWNELVANETDHLHNTIYKSDTSPYPSSWYDSCNMQGDRRYYCASKEITSYYMDPRNFLTEKSIFQFLDLSNSSPASVAQIQDAVRGTYLAGSANGESYAQIIYDAAKASGESAFSIVVRIFQELGISSSLPHMIAGNDATYPGVYNFFNYGASDGEGNLARGLAYAQKAGWTTPKTALIEGAKLIAGTYTKAGQVNKYLYKFDVVGTEKSQLYKHQYMTNVQDPNSQASILYNTYDQCDFIDKPLVFVIPVYKNMPAYVKLPNSENANGNLYFVSSNYDSVNFRTAPNGSVISKLRKDTVVTMIQSNINGFGKISCDGTIGYMSMDYLTKINKVKDNYYIPNSGKKYLGGARNSSAMISYCTQMQDIGWTGWGINGETIGVTDASVRLETIKISLSDVLKSEELEYRTHVEDIGWMDWVSDGNMSGTIGQSKRVEAIQIKLRELANYNVLYRVCIEGNTWTDWVKNGETAGTTGQSKPITAIQIKLEEAEPLDNMGEQYKGTKDTDENALISYNTYLQKAGWTGWRKDAESAGSSGQRRKIEALKIVLGNNIKNEAVQYRAHIQDIGWTDWVQNGQIIGTENSNKRIEAIQIKLKNGELYDVEYRVHVQDIGWMNWVKNGETAGTSGQSKRIEAIQIKLKKKENINIDVTYKTHIENIGWMNWIKNGEIAGTTGQSKRMEAIQIKLNDNTYSNSLQYKVHVQDIGWMNWVKNSETAGTTGQSKRIEAIQIKFDNNINKTIKYRVHVQDIGWMNWVKNGETAGTTGQSKRIEAIQIKIE